MRLFSLLLSTLLFLGGCSSKKVSKPIYNTKRTIHIKDNFGNSWIEKALSQEYSKWRGVPYKYGGSSLKGVDCSALIQIIYKDAFNLTIPRTTKYQAKIGYKINKNLSRVGDLVFFKTGWNSRHSGIILKKNKFIHSSTKYGVMISSLNNPYWKNRYWQIRRILP